MPRRNDLRNIAIIAHVDHGKTTLVDALLQQAGAFAAHEAVKDRVMDNIDQERERGITIMAKNTGIQLGDTRINIVDTPGHADFGGEVERTLHMVDGVLLLVDAAEGPLPQTRFVLEKALALGLSPMVCINKVDRGDARPEEVMQEVYDLFIDLGASDEQLDFPILYAVARDGWAVLGEPMGDVPEPAQLPQSKEKGKKDLQPMFDVIVNHLKGPDVEEDAPFQMLANAIAYDEYLGRLAVGRIHAGTIKRRQDIVRLGADGFVKAGKAAAIFTFSGLARVETEEARAGDIIAIAGLPEIEPGDTIATPDGAGPLERIAIDEPTLTMVFSVNDGPLSGLDGKYVTSRHIRDRLMKEAERNVALRVSETDAPDKFRVAGRGELSLAVLIEQMRREGFEMLVSRPEVVIRVIDGKKVEPMEGLVADLPEASVGSVTEIIGKRGGAMESMGAVTSGRVRVEFRIPTRGLIGFRNMFLTLTRGEGIMSTYFHSWTPYLGEIESRKSGAIISNLKGTTTPYALFNLQPRGMLFVKEGTDVYEGMVVGEHARTNDLDVNCCRPKKLTNVRASGKDEAVILTPARIMRLEEAMEFIDMDELIEITPTFLRLRKRVLQANLRPNRNKKKNKDDDATA